MTIYLDFDGTLIDASERYYRLYCDLLLISGCKNKMEKVQYWALKREKVNEGDIVRRTCPDVDVAKYLKMRDGLIESDMYTQFDRLFPWTVSTLERLVEDNRLVLVTARSSLEKTKTELARFGLDKYFDDVLISRNGQKGSVIGKDGGFDDRAVIVGDSDDECLAALELGVRGVMVSCGIRSREYLCVLCDFHVIDSIDELEILK